MHGLYAIIDTDALAKRKLDVIAFAEAVLAVQPAALQVRTKLGGAGYMLRLLRAIKPLAAREGVPLIANDRADLALLAGCDGVHLGQDDLSVVCVRKLSESQPRLRVGLSTHTRTQVEAAFEQGLDYVAIGPIFATSSKERPDAVIGLDTLALHCGYLASMRSEWPVVAIGGITLATAKQVGAIVGCAAVIGALLPQQGNRHPYDEVNAKASALQAAILTGIAERQKP